MVKKNSEHHGILSDFKIIGIDSAFGSSTSLTLLLISKEKNHKFQINDVDDLDFDLLKKSKGKMVKLTINTQMEVIE